MVLVLAEGAGQQLMAESMRALSHEDASGNKLLLDVGLWISQKIKVISRLSCTTAACVNATFQL